jgi:nucleotide-binding universal stress UspA family protein
VLFLAHAVLSYAPEGVAMIAMKRILVPIDFGEASDAALVYGRNLASTFGADLHVMHVMENLFLRPMANNPAAIEAGIANRLAEHITDDDRKKLHAVVVLRKSDTPAEEIVRYAEQEDIDLVVMGTHGRVNVAHFIMGSVAEKVVRAAACPVLTVRHPEREFVVPDTIEVHHDRA